MKFEEVVKEQGERNSNILNSKEKPGVRIKNLFREPIPGLLNAGHFSEFSMAIICE